MARKYSANFYKKVKIQTDMSLSYPNIPPSASFSSIVENEIRNEDDVEMHMPELQNPVHELNEMENIELIKEGKGGHISEYSFPILDSLQTKTSHIDNKKVDKEEDIKSKLKLWSIKYNISHVALSDLLKILKSSKAQLDELPNDARTILSTKRTIDVRNIDPGSYCHVGITEAVTYLCTKKCYDKIELLINIDGLPLSKSSGSQIYPILCSLYDDPREVAVIGVYHGYEKPSNANDFLGEFVQDAVELSNNGIKVNGACIPFKIKAFIADAPAKSFISYTKGHTGFFSCTKCVQKGEFIRNRTCFPKINSKKRTDKDFRQKNQIQHHTGTSALENIPDFNMVSDIPLEYMHLICLGVMKKLIVNIWIYGKPSFKLGSSAVGEISSMLLSFQNHTPIEFARKPRSLDDVKRWKATEFRFFLLYSGPVVLEKFLPQAQYQNFICLHIAIRILCNETHIADKEYFELAESLLTYFVQDFGNIYGQEFISHNIHGLVHIVDDVKMFGKLDHYSAFPFENFMQVLKNMVRKPDKPLSQIMKRLSERMKVPKTKNIGVLKYERHHNDGPTLEGYSTQFELVRFDYFTINIKRSGDTFCLLQDGNIMKVYNFIAKKEQIYVYGKVFTETSDIFSRPNSSCDSSDIDVYFVRKESSLETRLLDSVSKKMVGFAT